jgi:hypothetical protein
MHLHSKTYLYGFIVMLSAVIPSAVMPSVVAPNGQEQN